MIVFLSSVYPARLSSDVCSENWRRWWWFWSEIVGLRKMSVRASVRFFFFLGLGWTAGSTEEKTPPSTIFIAKVLVDATQSLPQPTGLNDRTHTLTAILRYSDPFHTRLSGSRFSRGYGTYPRPIQLAFAASGRSSRLTYHHRIERRKKQQYQTVSKHQSRWKKKA